MLDLGVLAVVLSTLQFGVQLKSYLEERKRRKRQEQEQYHQTQQQQQVTHYPHANYAASSPNMITYSLCYHYVYHVYPGMPTHNHAPYYMPPPAPFRPHLPLQAPHLYYGNSDRPAPGPPFTDHLRPVGPCSVISYNNDASPSRIQYPRATEPPSYDWPGLLHGHMEIRGHQRALCYNYYAHETHGMRTGAHASNNRSSSYNHWKSLQEEIPCSQGMRASCIAVVDWSRGNIDMFVEMEGLYFRNYCISSCDVATFAHLFKDREVFSAEIRDEKLERCNKETTMVEMSSGVHSTNSWMRLGIHDDSEDMQEVVHEQRSFVQMVRGAVFGLVCCLYEAPSDLNVEMVSANHSSGHQLDIVRVNTQLPPSCIVKRKDNCLFSVFAFGDQSSTWAAQSILLG